MSGSISASTVAMASLAVAAAGTAASVAGQMQQQQAQSQAAGVNSANAVYQSQLARQQQVLVAQQTQQQVDDAKRRGDVAEMNRRRLTSQQTGEQQARLAAQGTDLEGSPTDILGDTAAVGEFDAQTIRSNAAREAYGYKVAGQRTEMGLGNDATMASLRAANSTYSPSYLGAGSSLLSGASTLGEKWWRFQRSDPGTGSGIVPSGHDI